MYFHRICNYRLKLFKIHLSNLLWCERCDLDLFVQKGYFQNSYYRKCAILWKYRAMNIISVRFDMCHVIAIIRNHERKRKLLVFSVRTLEVIYLQVP